MSIKLEPATNEAILEAAIRLGLDAIGRPADIHSDPDAPGDGWHLRVDIDRPITELVEAITSITPKWIALDAFVCIDLPDQKREVVAMVNADPIQGALPA